jgi:membrane protease YdiL (CAAX protease family)
MVRAHPLLTYFGLALAISWLAWTPRMATEQGWWSRDMPEWWHYAGAAGPASAAVIVTALTEGRAGLRALVAHYDPRLAPGGWLLFAVASPLVLLGAGLAAARAADGAWPSYAALAKTSNLPALGLPLTFLVHLLTFGVGEETGWRGFALPRLQARRRALPATGLLLVGWATWHVPSFFENPDYADMAAPTLVGWGIGLALGAVFLTWLFNSAGGSLVVVVLWHGLFNTFSASEAPDAVPAVISTGVMVIAVAALLLAGPYELRGLSRRAGPRMRHEAGREPPRRAAAPAR